MLMTFHLTCKHASANLNVKFDSHAIAVVLPKGTFAPYNVQNTMIEYDA